MMIDEDGDLDHALREEGGRWRRDVPVTVHIKEEWFMRDPGEGIKLTQIVTATAALLLVAGVVLSQIGTGAPGPSTPPTMVPPATTTTPVDSSTPTQSPAFLTTPPPHSPPPMFDVVADGDDVTARGFLLQPLDGEYEICALAVSSAIEGAVPSCVEPSVTIVNVQSGSGDLVGQYVRADGVWNDGVLQARTLSPEDVPGPRDPAAPCASPAGGWPGNGSPVEAEAAARRIEGLVASKPGDYGGFWSAEIRESADRVFVVTTTQDPAVARDEVRALFEGNLCVVPVEFSKRELDTAAERLGASDASWTAKVDAVINRVVLGVPFIDAETAARLQDDAAILDLQPLVRPADVMGALRLSVVSHSN